LEIWYAKRHFSLVSSAMTMDAQLLQKQSYHTTKLPYFFGKLLGSKPLSTQKQGNIKFSLFSFP
jgi:hypothetical protein